MNPTPLFDYDRIAICHDLRALAPAIRVVAESVDLGCISYEAAVSELILDATLLFVAGNHRWERFQVVSDYVRSGLDAELDEIEAPRIAAERVTNDVRYAARRMLAIKAHPAEIMSEANRVGARYMSEIAIRSILAEEWERSRRAGRPRPRA